MEELQEILGVDMRPLIKLREFLEDFNSNSADDLNTKQNSNIFNNKLSNSNKNHLLTITAACDPGQAKHKDYTIEDYTHGIPDATRLAAAIEDDDCNLESYRYIMSHRTNAKHNPFQRTPESYKMNQWKSERPLSTTDTTTNRKNDLYYKEILITIRFYNPGRSLSSDRKIQNSKFSEEFYCLGSNLLTELRDQISCVCNKHHYFDISNNPEAPFVPKSKDPGFFFITDTFYNDMRNPSNADYSSTIKKWATTAPGFKEMDLKVAKMEETRFIDLSVSMGFPQVYQHHGNCEHVFTFSQIEILTPYNVPPHLLNSASTSPSVSAFPLLKSFTVFNTRPCLLCNASQSSYMVTESDRQLHDPAYLCKKCFYGYHYIDGKKIGKFKAYHINDDNYFESMDFTEE